jgi:predicted RND superfamily exporter protein
MNKLAYVVSQHKKFVLIIFFMLTAFCTVSSLLVSVNYNMVDYLPADAQSTIALEIMQKEFGIELPMPGDGERCNTSGGTLIQGDSVID